jgi:beta-glucosidase
MSSIWDTPSQRYVPSFGIFTVYVGASIRDIRLTGTISVLVEFVSNY